MKSFLTGRFQKVFLNGLLSNSVPITSGIFQGSILGPILFCLSINDIIADLSDIKFHLYADDLQIYLSCDRKYMDLCIDRINSVLNSILNWAKVNDIQLNTAKTQALVVTNQRAFDHSALSLLIDDIVIPFTSTVTNLGVVFDNKLTFEAHVDQICSQVHNTLRRLWPITRNMTVEMRKRLVISLIIPKFLYASPVYSGTSMGAWDKIRLAFNNCKIRFSEREV
jgi:hypothetical protein